jgi:hypothetical protein
MANPLENLLKKKFKEQPTLIKEYFEDMKRVPGEEIPETIPEISSSSSEFKDYETEMKRLYSIKDPKSGQRYDIPLLDINSPDYFFKYCNYMKIFERDVKTFNKILGWE